MFNLGSKSLFGISAFSLIVGVLYSLTSSDYSGSVLVLLATFAAASLAVSALAGTGAADRFALNHTEQSTADRPTVAPLAAAVGLGFIGLSLSLGSVALWGGLIVAMVSALVWFSAAWRSHPDLVDLMQPRIAERFSLPFLMPIAVLATIAILAISISRSFLATSKTGSWVLAAILGVITFGCLMLWAWRPNSRGVRQFLTVAAAISIVVLAVVGLAKGPRFDHEGHEKEASAEALHNSPLP